MAARVAPMVGVEQFLQNCSSSFLHGRPNGLFAGFQVHLPELLAVSKDTLYGALDFGFDLLAYRLDKVFFKASSSCASLTSRTGRSLQIASLTSTH